MLYDGLRWQHSYLKMTCENTAIASQRGNEASYTRYANTRRLLEVLVQPSVQLLAIQMMYRCHGTQCAVKIHTKVSKNTWLPFNRTPPHSKQNEDHAQNYLLGELNMLSLEALEVVLAGLVSGTQTKRVMHVPIMKAASNPRFVGADKEGEQLKSRKPRPPSPLNESHLTDRHTS